MHSLNVFPLTLAPNDAWHPHQTRLDLPPPDLPGGQDRLHRSVWFVDGDKEFRLDLTVLFGLCNRMRGVPQVPNPFIVILWV